METSDFPHLVAQVGAQKLNSGAITLVLCVAGLFSARAACFQDGVGAPAKIERIRFPADFLFDLFLEPRNFHKYYYYAEKICWQIPTYPMCRRGDILS